jgi:hypothetical protein
MTELSPPFELDDEIGIEEHCDESPWFKHPSSPHGEGASAAPSSNSMFAAANLLVMEGTDKPSGSNKAESRSPMYLGPFALQLGA